MIKTILLQQKDEKERLLAREYIPRDQMKRRDLLTGDLIKVITGPRRAGKSIFSLMLLKDVSFAYVNFDDETLLSRGNTDDLLTALFEVYPRPDYLFFDEIQNFPRWEIFVNKLHRRGRRLVLTGSNASLLSREFHGSLMP